LSISSKKAPPLRNPIKAGTHGMEPFASDISIAGLRSDQKLAAIITPAAKPSIEFKIFLFIDLKKKTMDAPRAVIPQVNKVAKRANNTGLYSSKNSSFIF
jgi:hypothetical protein